MNTNYPSFEEAMNAASLWCSAWEAEEISDEVLADRVSELLKSKNGVRGFFVISLSSDSPLMDRLPEALIFQLREAGELVVDITVKNLVMSSAMALHHKRNKSDHQKSSSQKIQRRCIEILRLLEPNTVKERLESFLQATQGEGKDVAFLARWNYDQEQKQCIVQGINSIAETTTKKEEA